MVKNKNYFKNFKLPQVINEGERNTTIFKYGASLKRKGRSESEVERLVKEANKANCNPPMSDEEISGIIRNVFSYCSGEPLGTGLKSNAPVKLDASLPPTEQAARQLESMFSSHDIVTFVTKFHKKKGEKPSPSGKPTSRVAYKVIEALRKASSMEDVFPGYDKDAGILFCVNPTDWEKRTDKDVTVFRSVVVEYDDISLDEQERRFLDSGLPIYSMTYSGGKSIHATVRIDAENYDAYKKTVNALYKKLGNEYGSPCDAANKNPSRLTRLAGSQRGKLQQTLLYTEINLDASVEDFLKEPEESKTYEEKLTCNDVANILIEEHGACLVEGVPAIRVKGDYSYGQDEVYRAVLGINPDASSHTRREVMSYISLMAPNRAQANPKFIRFKNGVLDIETLKLHPNNGNYLLLNEIPHNWNPGAKSELVDKVFNDIALGDAAVTANLWEMFGLSMYRGHEVSRMILLQGGGANGKSTLLTMLKCMLGGQNCFSLSIQELGEKFQLVPSMGKLALVGDDIASDFVGAKACAVMKKFVTGETVCDQYKGGATFEFDPYATLIYSCNEIPRFADSTFGFERRVHPIPLMARFTPSDKGYDPRLKQKLCQEECIEYALVKSVEALNRCLDSLSLTPNKLSEEMKKDILQENNPVISYIEAKKSDGICFVGRSNVDVYEDYKEWCYVRHLEAVNVSSFSKTLCSREGLTTQSSNGTRTYVPKSA